VRVRRQVLSRSVLGVGRRPSGSRQLSRLNRVIDSAQPLLVNLREKTWEQKLGANLRHFYRLSCSQPIVLRIHQACILWERKRRFLPQSNMGKAVRYLLKHYLGLNLYLDDPSIEIDNNLVENAIRPTAIGKKNWLFFGDAHAGQRSAVLYTLIASCQRHGVEPYSYLRDVLRRLPYMTNWQIQDITPRAWARAQRASPAKAA
jgi:hypothetical protein